MKGTTIVVEGVLKMLHKFTKILSLAMVIITAVLLVYTVVIGVRLWWCSFCVIDSRNYLSAETADQVYVDTNETRAAISDESGYAKIICNASGLMRCFIMLFELTAGYFGFVIYACMRARDKENAKRRAQRNRG